MTTDVEYPYTAADLAAELQVTRRTILRKASPLGIGINLGGRAGWRYSAADRARLIESLKPAAPVASRRRRRRAA